MNNPATVGKLLSEVQQRPLIFDYQHPSHKDKVAVEEAWSDIGQAIGVPGNCLNINIWM